jgi:flagellar protein FlaG
VVITAVGQTDANVINTKFTNQSTQDLGENIVVKTDEKIITEDKKYDKENLDKSLKKLNKFLEDDKVHSEYSFHKDLGDLMIKIVDDNTKEVIMELPPEKILDMIASMCKQFGLLDKKA